MPTGLTAKKIYAIILLTVNAAQRLDMRADDKEIITGLFVTTTDVYLIFPDSGPSLNRDIDLDFRESGCLSDAGFSSRFDRKQVSILGHWGTRPLFDDPNAPTVPTFVVFNIVTHAEIAELAFEIHQSGQGGSALDDWLHAERKLLGER
jgi:hypothetical protein